MRLEAHRARLRLSGPSGRARRRPSTCRPARSCACSAPTAAARPRCSAPCWGCCARAGRRLRLDGGRSRPRRAPRSRARRLRAAGARGLFPFTIARHRADGAHRAPLAVRGAGARRSRIAARRSAALGIATSPTRSTRAVGRRAAARAHRARARAGARILVMDEPTANLDFGNQARVLDEIARSPARGIAVVLSTHDPDQAFLCADRVALLHDGKLVADGAARRGITPRRAARGLRHRRRRSSTSRSRTARTRRVCLPTLSPLGRGQGEGREADRGHGILPGHQGPPS